MKINQELLDLVKGMDAGEILQMVALAKTGQEESMKAVSVNTVKDAEDSLEWFIDTLTK